MTEPIRLTIDHVTIAGPDLDRLRETFAGVGLATDYGGPHSNGITHMALLGFNDGSYIELIASLEPDPPETAFWSQHIAGNGGPCAWAVYAADVAAEAERVAALGVAVEGPAYYNRQRPDGKLVEWDLAFLGRWGAGAVLPFIIKDITPRARRVRPSASVVDGLLQGVVRVIVGVEDLSEAVALFRRLYHWPAPRFSEDGEFGARLAHFEAGPVTLAAPLAGRSWLADRLARFGPSPCAYQIGAADMEATRKRFPLTESGWFEPVRLDGIRLGIIPHPPQTDRPTPVPTHHPAA